MAKYIYPINRVWCDEHDPFYPRTETVGEVEATSPKRAVETYLKDHQPPANGKLVAGKAKVNLNAPGQLQPGDIIVGHTYRGKKPKTLFLIGFDDRTVVWRGIDSVQYDSESLPLGSKYPTVPMDKFLKWVGTDITEELRKGNADVDAKHD